MASILDLSTELHLNIISNLNITDRTCLKFTNRYFHHTIAGPKTWDKHWIMDELSPNPSAPKFLECSMCHLIRRNGKYADNERRRAARANGDWFWLSTTTFCIDCGTKKKKPGYRRGEVLVVQKQCHIICTVCSCHKLMLPTNRSGVCRRCCRKAGKVLPKTKGEAVVGTVG